MQYLVTMDYVDPGPLFPPQQVPGLIRQSVLPTFDARMRLRDEGKIVGEGVVAAARKVVFIMEAASNDDLNELVEGLPLWGLTVDVTPLQSFETRKDQDRQMAEWRRPCDNSKRRYFTLRRALGPEHKSSVPPFTLLVLPISQNG